LPWCIWGFVTIGAYVLQFKMNMTMGSGSKEKKEDWRRGGNRRYRYSGIPGGNSSGLWNQGRVWDPEKNQWEEKKE